MVKFPPGGRARGPGGRFRGPEAEPAVQPLIAKLKQDRLDSLAAADARVVQVIAEFTDRISEAIIAENKAMHTRHAELLAVPVNAKFKGVGIDYHLFLTGVEQWAENNGIKLTIGGEPQGIIGEKYWIQGNLTLAHTERRGPDSQPVKVFLIDFRWDEEDENEGFEGLGSLFG
jgi:hypothetical protein